MIAQSDKRPEDAEIVTALSGFLGDIQQVPPRFSAVKIDGQRAYKLARAGAEVEIEPRPLWVEEILLADRPDADTAIIEMTCGKGGYVRAIARDLGEALGCYGHVSWLRRVWSGPFDAGDGITMDEIDALARTAALDDRLRPLEDGLSDLTEVRATEAGAARLRNGNPGQVIASDVDYGEECWASFQGQAVAVGVYKAGELHPSRVFVPSAPAG